MINWLFGYTKEVKEEVKKDVKEDEAEIIPDKPPKLTRQTGVNKGNINEPIFWKNYDEEFKKIEADIKGLKEILNSDEKWKARLSPVNSTKKKRKKK